MAVIILTLKITGLSARVPEALEYIKNSGAAGIPLFLLLYLSAFILLLPVSALAVFAGQTYGVVAGTALSWAGATAGAAAAFFLMRFFMRGLAEEIIKRKEILKKADSNIEKNSVLYIIICRIIPFFPDPAISWIFGAVKIKAGVYLLWSALLMLPDIIYYTAGAENSENLLSAGPVIYAVIACAVILLIFTAKRYAKYINKDNSR